MTAEATGWRHFVASFILPDRSEHDEPPISEWVWRRVLLGLHVGFGALAALAVAGILTDHLTEHWNRPVGLAAVGAIVLTYAVAGRAALAGGVDGVDHRYLAVVYLLVVVAGIGVLARAAPDTLFIFFIVYPQVWFLVDRPRPGIFWTLLLLVASVGGIALRPDQTGADLVGVIGNQVVGVAFSVLLGIWISMLFDRSREQGRLIAQLELAKAEVAALERARGALAERERFTRDIHDTLAQGYTSILMLARTAMAQLDADPAAARERLELVEEVAEENLAQARALVAAQAPVELDGTSLRDALAQLATRFTRETGIEVDVRLAPDSTDLSATDLSATDRSATEAADDAARDGSMGLRPADELVLLRAAQEALTNARRHASPSRVSLTLQVTRPGEATVRIIDDGIGFAAGTGPGSGLTGLRRRVEEAGGELRVISAPGAGTQVVARVVSAQ